MELSQDLAEKYLKTPKRLKNKKQLDITTGEIKIQGEELISDEYGDIFKLDIRKNKIELKAINLNNRANDFFVLARLDVNDREHKNPDGKKIGETHIHIYKEGFNDRFAYDPEEFGFNNFDNISDLILQFAKFCKIEQNNFNIQGVLNDY